MTGRPKPPGRYWMSPRMRAALVAIDLATEEMPLGWVSEVAAFRLIGKNARNIAIAMLDRELLVSMDRHVKFVAMVAGDDDPQPPYYRLTPKGRREAARRRGRTRLVAPPWPREKRS